MRYFLEKAEKSPQRGGLHPQTPVPRPPSCYFHSMYVLIFSTAQHFSAPLKLKLQSIISYP